MAEIGWSWEGEQCLGEIHDYISADNGGGGPLNSQYVLVTQKLLNGPDVITRFQQVGRKAVAKGMRCGVLANGRRADGSPEGFLNGTGVDMVALNPPRSRIHCPAFGGEKEPPSPLPGGIGLFAGQGSGHGNLAEPLPKIRFPNPLGLLGLMLERGN